MKMSNNPAKYEVLIKQYLRSSLDISAKLQWLTRSMLKGNLGRKSTRVAKHKLFFFVQSRYKGLYLGRVHTMPQKFENAALKFYG